MQIARVGVNDFFYSNGLYICVLDFFVFISCFCLSLISPEVICMMRFLFVFDFRDVTEPSFLFQIQNHSFALRLICEIESSRYQNPSRMIH